MKPLIKATTIGTYRSYSAWEPGRITNTHTTITCLEEGWYGRIGTRILPAELEALPRSDDRTIRVHSWQEDQYMEAYIAIREQVEVPGNARYSMGEVSWTVQEVEHETDEELAAEQALKDEGNVYTRKQYDDNGYR